MIVLGLEASHLFAAQFIGAGTGGSDWPLASTAAYIRNPMTQPGETDGLDVSGHLRAIESQLASIGVQQRLLTVQPKTPFLPGRN